MSRPKVSRRQKWFVAALSLIPTIPAACQWGMLAWDEVRLEKTIHPDSLGFMLAILVFWAVAWFVLR